MLYKVPGDHSEDCGPILTPRLQNIARTEVAARQEACVQEGEVDP